jgi:hypothetical protein
MLQIRTPPFAAMGPPFHFSKKMKLSTEIKNENENENENKK